MVGCSPTSMDTTEDVVLQDFLVSHGEARVAGSNRIVSSTSRLLAGSSEGSKRPKDTCPFKV